MVGVGVYGGMHTATHPHLNTHTAAEHEHNTCKMLTPQDKAWVSMPFVRQHRDLPVPVSA